MCFVFLILIKEIQKYSNFFFFPTRIKKKEFLLYVYIVEKKKKRRKENNVRCMSPSNICKKVSNMSDVILFHSTNSKILPTKISLKLLSNGHIFVDWKDLPKHRNIRQCVIHYKSLNTNQVKFFLLFC